MVEDRKMLTREPRNSTSQSHQVTHLWEYDSYSHRAGVRAKLGGHQQWQVRLFLIVSPDWIVGKEEYFQKILPWLQHQDNMALRRWLCQLFIYPPASCPLLPTWVLVKHGSFGSWNFQGEAIGRSSWSNLLGNWKRRLKAPIWAGSSPLCLDQFRLHHRKS